MARVARQLAHVLKKAPGPAAKMTRPAAKAGITAIIQPGGSIRDEETIRMANHYAIAMIFTGQRHFRH